jgi:hypothetical protein
MMLQIWILHNHYVEHTSEVNLAMGLSEFIQMPMVSEHRTELFYLCYSVKVNRWGGGCG